VQHLCTAGGQLPHLVERNLRELLGRGHQSGVGGIDAVDVGVNLAEVGLHRGGDGDGAGIAAAAAEGGDVVVPVHPLEAGDNDDPPFIQFPFNPLGVDLLNPGAGVEIGSASCRESVGAGV